MKVILNGELAFQPSSFGVGILILQAHVCSEKMIFHSFTPSCATLKDGCGKLGRP